MILFQLIAACIQFCFHPASSSLHHLPCIPGAVSIHTHGNDKICMNSGTHPEDISRINMLKKVLKGKCRQPCREILCNGHFNIHLKSLLSMDTLACLLRKRFCFGEHNILFLFLLKKKSILFLRDEADIVLATT